MDPLSITASIIAVLHLTYEISKYLGSVKDAPKECQQCIAEASNLSNLLISLMHHMNLRKTGDTWNTTVQTLNVKNGPIDQYKQALERLQSRAKIQDGIQKIKRQLLWKFCREEVKVILARLERLKTLVSIALEMDHSVLSQAIKEDTSSIRDNLPSLQTNVDAIRNVQNLQWDVQQHQVIMEWLSAMDFSIQQHDILSQRQEGTGRGFLDSLEFQRWLQGHEKRLFCPGMPGAGKTMMAAAAIDYLGMIPGGVGLAYLFCNYNAQINQSVPSLFGALLKQLVQNRPEIAAPVRNMYDNHSKRNDRPTVDELLEALQSICSHHTTVYIVVDALDECEERNSTRSQLINKLCLLQGGVDVRLLFTSRPIPEITQFFETDRWLEVRANEEDVRRFIVGQIPRLPSCIQRDEELKLAVQGKIVEAVDGMFLLARLHVDSLLDKRTKRKVLSTLNNLSKASAALDEAYGEAIKRIDGQLPEDRVLARRAISWITYSKRSLTTQELCHALALEPGDKALNEDNINDVEDVVSVCAGLVIVDKESSIVRLVHYTTQEYFERIRSIWHPSAQEEIAAACLTCLSFDSFRSGSSTTSKDFEQRLAENPFFDYSAHYWAEHVRPMQQSTVISNLALIFLCNNALLDATVQVTLLIRHKHLGFGRFFRKSAREFPIETTGLHITAKYGLLYLSERLLMGKHGDVSTRADCKDCNDQTPLSIAAANGHEAIVKLLLKTSKVNEDSRDYSGRTPLSIAAANGHEAIVKLLLETGKVNEDSQDLIWETPLSRAAENGHEAVVTRLLETGKVNADSQGWRRLTPLSWAAKNGHEAIIIRLLETGKVNEDSQDKYKQTPLSWAAKMGHEIAVTRLLETNKVNPNLQDTDGRTPLSWAAQNGHEAVIVQFLKTDKVKTDLQDKVGRTPLKWAELYKRKAVVRLLVEAGETREHLQHKVSS